MPVGATISSFLTGMISDYGRRRCLFIANAIFLLGTAISIMPSIFSLIIGRIIIGFSIGIFSVIVPIFISEISPVENKGSYGVARQIAVTFGILVASIMGTIESYHPSYIFLCLKLLLPLFPLILQ
mmetsp:Transcript_26131/g.23127  ORF Transcript_26131/g.23127 Transcript_26131/m.23127 type:complete len:126 (+) Transcript_26131:190-567(+)